MLALPWSHSRINKYNIILHYLDFISFQTVQLLEYWVTSHYYCYSFKNRFWHHIALLLYCHETNGQCYRSGLCWLHSFSATLHHPSIVLELFCICHKNNISSNLVPLYICKIVNALAFRFRYIMSLPSASGRWRSTSEGQFRRDINMYGTDWVMAVDLVTEEED